MEPAKSVQAHDALAKLEDVKPNKGLSAMVDGAFSSLRHGVEQGNLIALRLLYLTNSSSNHPQLQQVIQKIQVHTVVYCEAIDTSIKTAQDGFDLSCDAIGLCGYLLEPDTDPNGLQEYIGDLHTKANRVYEDSLTTLNKFRDVRQGLIEVCYLTHRHSVLVISF
jgi:hypothetical protein